MKDKIQIYNDDGKKIWVDKNYVKDKQKALEKITREYREKTDAQIKEFLIKYRDEIKYGDRK